MVTVTWKYLINIDMLNQHLDQVITHERIIWQRSERLTLSNHRSTPGQNRILDLLTNKYQTK